MKTDCYLKIFCREVVFFAIMLSCSISKAQPASFVVADTIERKYSHIELNSERLNDEPSIDTCTIDLTFEIGLLQYCEFQLIRDCTRDIEDGKEESYE